MAILISKVTNNTSSSLNIFVPGYNPDQSLIIVPNVVNLDLLSSVSYEQLWTMQGELARFISEGSLTQTGTFDTTSIEGPGTDFVPSNILYVDGVNGNDSNAGGPLSPFQTIQKALTTIGSASSISDYDNPATSRWSVQVAPGTYTEDLTIGTRQIIDLDLNNALIVGNVTQTLNTADEPGTIRQNKLLIRGRDLRSAFASSAFMPISGIQGNLTILQSGFPNEFYAQVHLMQVGITGNFIGDVDEASPYTVGLFASDAFILGTITALDGVTITLIAENCDTDVTNNMGGVSGTVNLYVLRNVRFSNTVVASGAAGNSRWYNVTFPVGANDFTGYIGPVVADSNSYASFQTNVPTKGSFSFTLIDTASGISYTPAIPSNWSVVPTTVQQALDAVAAKIGPI